MPDPAHRLHEGGRVRRHARRFVRVAAIAVFALAGLVVVPTGTAGAADDTSPGTVAEQRMLAERYAPVMKLVKQERPCGPGEPYLPSDVRVLMENPSVALRGPWADEYVVRVGPGSDELSNGLPDYALDLPGDPLKPGCSYEKWADTTWEGVEPTIYAHIATQPKFPDRLALQYWFYYPFNDFNNKHESDWERIQVEWDVGTVADALQTDPVRVAYSQHYGSEHADWSEDSELEISDDTHPVVYVSEGSHSSHLTSALFLGRSGEQGFGCDTTLAPHDTIEPVVELVPTDPAEALEAHPWVGYQGRWGQREDQAFYDAPTGPNEKGQWTKPFTWSDAGNNQSHPVPGGGILSDAGTDTFCRVVQKGSDIYRDFTRSPAVGAAVLVAFAAAVIWLVRRTRWSSVPTPVQQRRSFGQIVTTSLTTYWTHAWVLLGIGLLPVAMSVLSTLVQQLLYGSGVTINGSRPGVEIEDWVGVVTTLHIVAMVLAVLLAQAAVTRALLRWDAGEEVTVVGAYRLASSRIWALVRSLVAYAVGVVVCLVLVDLSVLLVPVAAFFLVRWSLFVPVLEVEDRAGIKALRRSGTLVWPQFFKVASLHLLAWLVAIVLGVVPSLAAILSFQVPFLVINLLPGIVSMLTVPFASLLLAYAYFNGRAIEGEKVAAEPEDAPEASAATAS
jgi:hypothetical protein